MKLPRRFWAATLDKIQQPAAKKAIEAFLTDPAACDKGNGLAICGDYGLGKTSMAAILLKGIAQRRKWGLFVKAADIPGYLINDTPFDEEETYPQRMYSVDLLVIDDFRVMKNPDSFITESADRVLRARSDDLKSVIFTTNLVGLQLKDRVRSIYDILSGMALFVNLTGTSQRQNAQKELQERYGR